MFESIWQDIKQEFSYGNMVKRIVIVNVAVYIAVNLLWVILRLTHAWTTPPIYQGIIHFFSISSDWLHNLTHPWAIFTHMFLHEGFFHILWNMLFLWWFAPIVGDLLGDRRMLPLYLICGLASFLAFFIGTNILPGGGLHYALGASGAVTGILVSAGVLAPDKPIRLFLLGTVRLKWIVLTILLIDLVGVAGDVNTGGHFGHLGGAVMGGIFVLRLRRGDDLTRPVNRGISAVQNFFAGILEKRPAGGPRRDSEAPRTGPFTRSSGVKTKPPRSSRRREEPDNHQERIDAILDKLREKGYQGLSQEEKDYLNEASKK